MSREAMQGALEDLLIIWNESRPSVRALQTALAEQPAAPVPTSFEDWWFKESTLDALEKNLTVEQECRLVWDAAIAAAIPPGCVVVPVEPTPEMKRAATLIAPTWDDHISAAKYRAMLAARPGGSNG